MNFIKRWLIQKAVTNMLTKVFSKLDGFKTYITVGVGILTAVVAHFWGPLDIAGVQIPQLSWGQVWAVLWGGTLGATMRNAIAKVSDKV